ncbi:MAG: hypothetical protein HRT36_06620 [Alphaproteobacteria bacterium]|nr:hypothetical protein [Alphaproteobacteria bacterium]
MAMQLYFSCGAYNKKKDSGDVGLQSIESKQAFLNETFPILERIANVGVPSAIHYLLEVLVFMMDAEPNKVFDLTTKALLVGGQKHDYQNEDQRELFNNTTHRKNS